MSARWPAAVDLGDLPRITAAFQPFTDSIPAPIRDPALGDDHIDVTPDNCGLGDDPVARVLYLQAQLAEAMELLTDADLSDLAQYDRPLRSVA